MTLPYSQISWSPLETKISRSDCQALQDVVTMLDRERTSITGALITTIYFKLVALQEQGATDSDLRPIFSHLVNWISDMPLLINNTGIDEAVKDDILDSMMKHIADRQ